MAATHNPQPTTHNPSPVPRLDLAPKRKKPLSLWNPLDYLTLLYWAFFFPQAIRWYVETFGLPEYRRKARTEVWNIQRPDSLREKLVIQALLTLLVFTLGTVLGLQTIGISINWTGVAIGAGIGVLYGLLVILNEVGVAGGVAFAIMAGLLSGVTGGVTFSFEDNGPIVVSGILLIIFLAFGVGNGAVIGVASGVAFGIIVNTTGAGLYGAIPALGGLITFSVMGWIVLLRLLEWLLAWPLMRLRDSPFPGTQMAWLPIPGYQRKIERWLENDWGVGVCNINQLLAYTMQFIPVVGAINVVLANSSRNLLLPRVSLLAEKPFDWKLLRSGSIKQHYELFGNIFGGIFSFGKSWDSEGYSSADLRLDTHARAACAGFWYWHKKEAPKAADAFAVVKDIPHGLEIYGIAQAIVAGQKATALPDLAVWDGVGRNVIPTDGELRPGTLRALRVLSEVAAEARTAHHAVAPLNRAAAIGRANAALTNLLETGADFCPEPEWPLIEEIAKKWRDIVSKAGGVIGEEVLRQPVLNPYEGYSGLPVTGHTFVGRRAIMSQIERHWANPGAMPPLILYGHRRMGKSSILRNLDKGLPRNTLLVYLDMQGCATLINHTGDLLREFAKEICEKCVPVFPEAVLEVSPSDYTDVGTARFALNALLARLNQYIGDRRVVLAVDEFETIQDKIDEGHIDQDVLKYLRSRIQEYHWLALIFAGLHQLDELGRDYKSVFYGQAEHIRVSYLSEADAIDLIARPHPDFALEYAPELRAELYRLTYGQPYLLQRLCWELVERWNERFLREGKSTPRELVLDALPPILTPDFYHAAGYYFDGLWHKNLTEDERAVLRVMAERETPWVREELVDVFPNTDLDAVFALLKRHDVVLEDEIGVRFASELLRRWIVRFSTD
ncbi:MAG: AAA family ATPase [Anaerolineae bacterium]|nr:AAA family ATPase [Anaerolineae bacterium]